MDLDVNVVVCLSLHSSMLCAVNVFHVFHFFRL